MYVFWRYYTYRNIILQKYLTLRISKKKTVTHTYLRRFESNFIFTHILPVKFIIGAKYYFPSSFFWEKLLSDEILTTFSRNMTISVVLLIILLSTSHGTSDERESVPRVKDESKTKGGNHELLTKLESNFTK